MIRALILALREIKSYLLDTGDLAFSLLLPVVTFALLYGAFGGQENFHGTAYIVNKDTGAYSQQLVASLKKNRSLDIRLLDAADADRKLKQSDITLVMIIPSDFTRNLRAGLPVQIIFKQRGNGGQEGQIVSGLERSAIADLNRNFQVQARVREALAGHNIPSAPITAMVQRFMEKEKTDPLVSLREETLGAGPDMVNQFLPGVITMYVLFAITISSRAIVEERKRGTLERLLTTRLTAGQLFIGKFLAGIGRAFVQTLILLLLSCIVFRIFTPRSFLQVSLIALVFAAAGSALGLVIASLARAPDSATWIGVFFTMGSVMLGGTFFTINKDSIVYTLSKFSINTYANDSFRTLMIGNGSLTDVGMEMAVMVGVTVMGLIISRLLFKTVSISGQ